MFEDKQITYIIDRYTKYSKGVFKQNTADSLSDNEF